MKAFLFREPIIPVDFKFPPRYEEMARTQNWPDLEPWAFMAGDMADSLRYYGAMLGKFPQAPLIPFAWITDETGYCNDGYVVLACFDGSDTSGDPRVRIYDYGAPKKTPWDNYSFENFEAWLVAAREESDRFKAEKAERDAED